MADLPFALKPVSLAGPTWDRLREAAYGIPDGQHHALIAAASLDEKNRPQADMLLVNKFGDHWYVAGSVGYKAGQPSFAVMTTATW